jgi:hypothetical protein
MKKFIAVLVFVFAAVIGFGQSDKYVKAMEQKVPAIDTTHTVDALIDLGNSFERIADAEKTQWLPYYYAALTHVDAGLMMGVGGAGGNAAKTDPEADRAEALLLKAQALTKDNSEIFIVKKMISTLRMMGDPMNRYMTEMPIASEALENAKKLDPNNPRIYLLEAQDKFYTPEQYGGSKDEAKTLFQEAQKKFDAFKPESSIYPNWGRAQLGYFMSQYK